MKKITEYWQIIVAIAIVTFNVGYTVAKLDEKPSKEEVKKEIINAIESYRQEIKEMYIRIDQIPGLQEQLKLINEQLEILNKKFDKFEDKFIYQKK